MEIYKEALILKLISYKEEGKLILTNMVGQLKNVMSCIVVCVYMYIISIIIITEM